MGHRRMYNRRRMSSYRLTHFMSGSRRDHQAIVRMMVLVRVFILSERLGNVEEKRELSDDLGLGILNSIMPLMDKISFLPSPCRTNLNIPTLPPPHPSTTPTTLT